MFNILELGNFSPSSQNNLSSFNPTDTYHKVVLNICILFYCFRLLFPNAIAVYRETEIGCHHNLFGFDRTLTNPPEAPFPLDKGRPQYVAFGRDVERMTYFGSLYKFSARSFTPQRSQNEIRTLDLDATSMQCLFFVRDKLRRAENVHTGLKQGVHLTSMDVLPSGLLNTKTPAKYVSLIVAKMQVLPHLFNPLIMGQNYRRTNLPNYSLVGDSRF